MNIAAVVYTKSRESGTKSREIRREIKIIFPTISKSRRISRLLVSFPTNFPTFSYLLGSTLKVGGRKSGNVN